MPPGPAIGATPDTLWSGGRGRGWVGPRPKGLRTKISPKMFCDAKKNSPDVFPSGPPPGPRGRGAGPPGGGGWGGVAPGVPPQILSLQSITPPIPVGPGWTTLLNRVTRPGAPRCPSACADAVCPDLRTAFVLALWAHELDLFSARAPAQTIRARVRRSLSSTLTGQEVLWLAGHIVRGDNNKSWVSTDGPGPLAQGRAKRGGGGLGPKVNVPKMARPDFPYCKVRLSHSGHFGLEGGGGHPCQKKNKHRPGLASGL